MFSKSSSLVKPLTGLRKLVTLKFQNFLEGYESLMLKRFPATYRMLQMFSVGTKSFIGDVFEYVRCSKDLTFDRTLTYKQLILYDKTPKDIRKMLPFLVITAVPFAQYVTLPVAMVFPKMFLSSHYWTITQRTRFALQDHTHKLKHYRPVFRIMQNDLFQRSHEFGDLNHACQTAFAKLASGTHPSLDLVIQLKPLFVDKPFGIDDLAFNHLYHLCRMYKLSGLPGCKLRLKNHMSFVRILDKSLLDADLKSLNLEDLKHACFMRGLNPLNMHKHELLDWLESWTKLSQQLDGKSLMMYKHYKNVLLQDSSLSLLAHAPIFLAYNHPSNWKLVN